MNLLNILQHYTTQIMDDPLLSANLQEQKIIQVFDLCHFIDIYGCSLKILDYKHKINVIEEDGIRKGVFFFDLAYDNKYQLVKEFYKPKNIQTIRNQLKIKELWFVTVIENVISDDLKASREFITKNNINSLYDKVFYFNFSKSIIKIIN